MKLKKERCATTIYPGQTQPQPKRLRIRPDTQTVIMDVDPEIGNAVTADVWHNRELVLYFNGLTPTVSLRRFYAQNRALFLAVCQGHSIDWDGSNRVGKLTPVAVEAWHDLCFAARTHE